MKNFLFFGVPLLLLTACGHTYYVVRHAEKATQGQNMSSDVPLSQAGIQRAEALKVLMVRKKIGLIFSTNTIRTMATAKPTADYFNITIQPYGPRPDPLFIDSLRKLKVNTLIVGHSNTVDDLVNGLTGMNSVPGDLQDNEYNNLFVITIKKRKVKLEKRKYGN